MELYTGSPDGRRWPVSEKSLHTIETLLNDVVEVSNPDDHLLSDINNETNVQDLLKSFEIKPSIPARLNELQFQLFTDFVYTWRFYFDDTSIWDQSSSLFPTLAIGLLRIAAWDFEVRNTDTEELPITFSSFPRWKVPPNEIFWFHKYLILCCNTDQIGFMLEKAKHFVSQSTNHKGPVHGIAISIQHIALFEICNSNILRSAPIPLVTNTSALHCSPGFRMLAYIFTSSRYKGFSAESREYWGVTLPMELFEMILATSKSRDLVSMAQASDLVEQRYYSSIPQLPGLMLHNSALSIPCCGKRNTLDATGAYCSVCYAWSHLGCAGLSSSVPSDIGESLSVRIVKRADLVLLLRRAVFTNTIVQSEYIKHAAWFIGVKLCIFDCESLSHPLDGLNYGSSEATARPLHERLIIQYSSVGSFLVSHMDLTSSTIHENIQRFQQV